MIPLVETKDLKTYFPVRKGIFKSVDTWVRAVDGVNMNIMRNETLGLVGESGSGKTTLGKTILRLHEPTHGAVYFEGEDISTLGRKEFKKISRHIGMVFQSPHASLNPRLTILGNVGEPLLTNGVAKGKELRDRVLNLLENVGLSEDHLLRYPHEFSGGQRQRIGIARSIALNPKLVILDEPTSALDVSVQAKVLRILKDIQNNSSLSYLFISHNLSVIKLMSDRIAVMYLGKIVESLNSNELLKSSLHPYTLALLSSAPGQNRNQKGIIYGEVPNPVNPPSGCNFHPRCPKAIKRCENEIPELINIEKNHFVACHLAQ
jgi:oligopeptide/dipeptide ABC transporter ATP-binding protein